jgi:hypothetical protein
VKPRKERFLDKVQYLLAAISASQCVVWAMGAPVVLWEGVTGADDASGEGVARRKSRDSGKGYWEGRTAHDDCSAFER